MGVGAAAEAVARVPGSRLRVVYPEALSPGVADGPSVPRPYFPAR